jgi:hypothetical protein
MFITSRAPYELNTSRVSTASRSSRCPGIKPSAVATIERDFHDSAL